MVETLADSGAVKYKAGANANATIVADAVAMTQFINQAESYVSAVSKIDWSGAYESLTTAKRKIFEDAVSSKAAMAVINYDMSGYTGKREAETMLDYNSNMLDDAIRILKEKPNTDFIQE